jgi:Trypsin
MYKMTSEAGAVSIDGAKKIILHPSVAGTKPRVFNVALIVLKAPVAFSDVISPVCLHQPSQESILGRTVFAVGFGVDQSGSISSTKKHVAMVVLDDSICQKFFNETLMKGKASKFFCARGNGVETPCRFDKPLYIKRDDRWYLQAMSSTFKVFKNSRMCRPRAPVLYEDITQLTDWIESETNQDKNEV